MRILVLSFYYPPDLSAGSFRTGALVDALLQEAGPQDKVHVLTTAPNRYASFRSEIPLREEKDRLIVERIKLPAHRSGFRDQAFAFSHFAHAALRCTRDLKADVVFATSSRLMTAALAGLVARRLGARLHLDIRDLFTDTLASILKNPARLLLLPVFSAIERWTLRQADAISIVSPGFETHVCRLRPDISPTLRTNGIDREFLDFDYDRAGNEPPVILYAGNIGEGQGLEHLVPEAARRLAGRYRFCIIGDGGRRRALEKALDKSRKAAGTELPVELLPPVDRNTLMAHYASADILLLQLNDYPAFSRVLPSKLFEYGATGKPILAGIAGVAADFVHRHLVNAVVYRPCDPDDLESALGKINLGQADRGDFIAAFKREEVMKSLARDILSL